MPINYGPGDPATWGPCFGQPNDPRTDDEGDEADEPEDVEAEGDKQ